MRVFMYLVVWSLFPVLYLYVTNADQTDFSVVLPVLVLAPSLVLLIYSAVRRFFLKDTARAGIFTLFLTFFLFSFGHFFGFLHGKVLKRDHVVDFPVFGGGYLYGFIIGLVLFVMYLFAGYSLARALKQNRVPVEKLSRFLLIMGSLLVAFQGMNYFAKQEKPAPVADPAKGVLPDLDFGTSVAGQDLPDIYFIVPDGFARADILATRYDYDLKPFVDSLKTRGFQVPSKSYASFYWTYLSLSSTLNMDYVTPLAKTLGVTSRRRALAYSMVARNRVAQYLKSRGYKYYQTASTWGATLKNPFADELLKCRNGHVFQTEFYRVLVEISALRPFLTSVGTDLADCHLQTFANLKRIPSEAGGPRFVFAHIVPPHHPYLFDRQGNVIRRATIANQFDFQADLWKEKPAYVEQLEFISKQLLEISDAVKASGRKAIVIFASDHGPHLDFELSGLEAKQARLSNFVAVRSYDPNFKLPDSMRLANLFRYVLAHHLKAPFPTLPEHSYYSDYHSPYKFEEVSFK